MGAEVEQTTFTREARKLHREKVRRGLDVLARMLTESRFDFAHPMAGLEIELNLIDDDVQPAMRNAEVLAAVLGRAVGRSRGLAATCVDSRVMHQRSTCAPDHTAVSADARTRSPSGG